MLPKVPPLPPGAWRVFALLFPVAVAIAFVIVLFVSLPQELFLPLAGLIAA
ncbi:hypothetical protein [Methanoregula sp.]|uniref:hypothetical protein n=1 Tax=Methanoregula sp. TaxID=2052170 RepID=UPI00262A33C6|nr:hypothetical protein [Methanoregula sp.]MDD5144206.1 hypothetical protein [Methanoregula sp.]